MKVFVVLIILMRCSDDSLIAKRCYAGMRLEIMMMFRLAAILQDVWQGSACLLACFSSSFGSKSRLPSCSLSLYLFFWNTQKHHQNQDSQNYRWQSSELMRIQLSTRVDSRSSCTRGNDNFGSACPTSNKIFQFLPNVCTSPLLSLVLFTLCEVENDGYVFT